jgi:hypothetical protein
MKQTFNNLKKYIQCINPHELKIYDDFYNRPNPKTGDEFQYIIHQMTNTYIVCDKMKFIKVEYDPEFTNGVAFWYIFEHDNEEIKVWSINDVYDPEKLKDKERLAVYAFWKYCKPINK